MDSTRIAQIASGVLNTVRGQYGNAWQNLLSPADQQLLADTAFDAVQVMVDALIDPNDPKLAAEKRQINATLANLAACVAGDAAGLLWGAIQTALNGAIAVAVASV